MVSADEKSRKVPAKKKKIAANAFKSLPWQAPYLEACLNPDIPFVTACVGRRAGKTYGTVHLIKQIIKNHKKTRNTFLVWWVAPTYPTANIAFDVFMEICPPGSAEYNRIVKKVRRTDPKQIQFNNGAIMEFKSADKPNSLLGKGVDFLVIDEAARIQDEVWERYLSPTLADKGGNMVAISTPFQKNWFYDMWLRGNDPDQPLYASFHGSTTDNLAAPGIRAWVEEQKRTSPAHIFRQEIEAVFLEEDSDVFRGIKNLIYQAPGLSSYEEYLTENGGVYVGEEYKPGENYKMGVDVAKIRDWTVVVIVKVENQEDEILKKVVYLDRFQGDTYQVQKQRVLRAWKRYRQPHMVVDASGKGDAFVDELLRNPDSIPQHAIEPFIFTTYSKQTLIQSLQADIDHGRVTYPRIQVLLNEMSRYQFKIMESGHIKYSAPSKQNDDVVIALALACKGAQRDDEVEVLGAYSAAILGF